MADFIDSEAEESEEEEELNEQERKKVKRIAMESSDEDEDDEDKLREELEDLIDDAPIEDDDESDDENRKRKISDDELDDRLEDDDYDLIEENLGMKVQRKKQFKRLKRIEDDESDEDGNEAEGHARDKIANELFDSGDEEADRSSERRSAVDHTEAPEFEEGEGEDYSDADDFIVDDNDKPIAAGKKKKAPIFSDAALQEAQDIFGVEFDFDEFERFDEDEEYSDEDEEDEYLDEETEDDLVRHKKKKHRRKVHKKSIFEIYEPSELKRGHFTDLDNEIRNADIPERMQLREVPVTSVPEGSDELDEEAKWIYNQVYAKPSVSTQDCEGGVDPRTKSKKGTQTIGKIKKALDFMRNQQLEVPFIAFYRKEYVLPELTISDLWKVYKYDAKWCQLKSRKGSLQKLYENMRDYQNEILTKDLDAPIPDDVRLIRDEDIEWIKKIQTPEEVKDMQHHFFLYYAHEVSKERTCGSESDSEYATGEDQLEDESSERAVPNKSPITILSDVSLPPIEQSSTSLITGDSDLSSKKSRVRVVATICLDLCSYELVGRVARQCGMTVVDDKSLWDVLWSDPCIGLDTHQRMKRFQRTNHFPLIMELCRKNLLAKNLNQMKKQYPNDYNFFPQTWILPRDNREVHAFLTSKKATVIVKPDNGSNGLGISLIRNLRHLRQEPNRNYICQQYIANPFLIDGFKFDIRVYTLITSCDPMRIYVHKDGIVRFATVKYERPQQGNLTNTFMHLTNYSVNKHSISFIHDEEVGSKRKISTMNQWFCRMGYDTDLVWSRIDDVIVKTVLSAHPKIKKMYNSVFPRHNYMTACFQLLGFDILLDDTLNPYVLEVNHSPSFYTDTNIDVEIKEQVLRDTFILCNLNSSIKRKVLQEERLEVQRRLFKRPEREEDEEDRQGCKERQWAWERAHMGNFRLLYPCQDGDKYDSMCRAIESASYYKDTFSSNMRSMLGRAHRQDIDMRRDNHGVTPRPSKDTLDSIYGKKRRKPGDDVALMKKPTVRTNKTKVVKPVQTKRKVETPRDSYNRKDVEDKAKQLNVPKVLVDDKPKPAIQVKVPKIAQKPAKKPVKPTHVPLKPANSPKPTSVPAKAANIPAKSTSIPAKPTNNSAKPANIISKLVTIPSKSVNPKPTKPAVAKGQRRSKAPPEANIDPAEEIHRLTEWKKRVTFVESMDIKRLIYFCFKTTNNLSDRDLLLHRYLEVNV
ncbi:hypothetical protein M8J77_011825 [Diaphorina citri]|nr:hypothetical protein M8J77_011825 [Diaphorina citri]